MIGEEYELEYGKDRVEIHTDAVKKGDYVVLVDDLIATGGTAFASIKLLERAGAQVRFCEDEIGHKLSANGLRALEEFFA